MMTSDTERRLCRYAGGICATGYRKTHVRSDPACRFYGASDKETGKVAVMSCRQQEPSQSSGGSGPHKWYTKAGESSDTEAEP